MPDTDMNQLIAKNVRKQMVKRDVTAVHVTHKLKLKEDQARGKLNGKIPFSDEELEILAPYLDTTFEALQLDPEPPVNGKAAEPPSVPSTNGSRGASPLVRLIGITDGTDSLSQLVDKTFMAKLAGAIPDLAYILRNNVLIKAIKEAQSESSFSFTEEDKSAFVEHYCAKYEEWKAALVSDIDEVTAIALTSNHFDAVSSVAMPSEKGRLSQFMNGLLKANSEEGVVDITALGEDVEKAIGHLQRVKGLLQDYLAANEK